MLGAKVDGGQQERKRKELFLDTTGLAHLGSHSDCGSMYKACTGLSQTVCNYSERK